jgi:hypothetical protein
MNIIIIIILLWCLKLLTDNDYRHHRTGAVELSPGRIIFTNFVSGYSVANGYHTITTTVPHNIVRNTLVKIHYNIQDPINGFTYFRSAVRKALFGTAGSTVVVKEIKDINTVVPTQIHER